MQQPKEKQTNVRSEMAIADKLRSMVEFFHYLLRKWPIIFLVGLIGGLLGVTYAWLQKPKYQSHLTFALEESSSGLGDALSLASEFGFNIGGSKSIFEGDNILEIFTSRRIIERVLLSVDTVDSKLVSFADNLVNIGREGKKIKKPGRLDSISFPVGLPREKFSYLQDSVLFNLYQGIVKGDLSVSKPDKKLNIYQIQFTSLNERFAKVFTDKLVKETTEFYTELRSRRARQTLQILESRVAETKGSLNTAINGRTSIQDANINPAFAKAQAPLQQKQVDISAYGGAYGELYKNLELARYQYLKDIPLLQIIDNADYPMKRIKDGRLKDGIIFSLIFGFLTIAFFSIRYAFLMAFTSEKEQS